MSASVAIAIVRHIISSIPTVVSGALSIGAGLGGMRSISKDKVHDLAMPEIEEMTSEFFSPATCTEVAIAYNEELTSQEARKTPKKQAEARARVAAYEELKDILSGLDEALVEKFEAKQRRTITSRERAAAIVVGVVSEHVKLELGTLIKEEIVPACREVDVDEIWVRRRYTSAGSSADKRLCQWSGVSYFPF